MALTTSDTQKLLARFLNPWSLHLQKLGLELKCPLCLNLLNKPMLLPCNHIFCHGCIPNSTELYSECASCKSQFFDEDVRLAPHMENMVAIYRSLDATFSATFLQSLSSGAGLSSECLLGNSQKIGENKSGKEGTSSNRQPTVSLKANMQNHALLNACTLKKRETVCDVQDKVEQCVGLSKDSDNHMNPVQGVGDDGLQRAEIDMNHEPQPSPGSSNSFSATKDGDFGISDPLNTHSDTKLCKTRKTRENEMVMSRSEVDVEPTKEKLFQVVDVKRQKKQSYGSPEYVLQDPCHNQLGSSTTDIAISKSNMQSMIVQQNIAAQGPIENKSVCAFCHSSKISEGSGEMLHYANGKEVIGDISHHSNVITVHTKCIDWTPQVYYEGDVIKNLEPELARAAKLKCSCCGLKGAGLGCFAKSCRKSYHAPCAYEVQECRWDCDDFLMLCPSHNNLKFPREKSNRRKLPKLDSKTVNCVNSGEDPLTNNMLSKQLSQWAGLPNGQSDWVFCGSALSTEERHALVEFARICGAKVIKNFEHNVTHVVAATEGNGACRRTLKVLMAILHGKWIVSMDWVKACTGANSPMDEEPYEFGMDNHRCLGGPKAGRLRAMTNAPKLFEGLTFYVSGDFIADCKCDLLYLIHTAGGIIIKNTEQFMLDSCKAQSDTPSHIVVYNRDPPPGCPFGEGESIISQRKAEAVNIANGVGAEVVRHTWILESVAACQIIPFRNLS
ncbi:hypothetical protein LIER_21551 [Lithospermum erythrorhizon]|uniref:Uncharacterized protein n=1 Tax=Lithospermum erythrorhizon TaxID=34254 RepID=A0AAV3QQL6_LITER